MFTSMFALMSLFVPFSPFKSIILPHSSYWTGKIKTPHLNLWVALKYKATNYIYTVYVSLFLFILLLSFSPFLSPLLFSHLSFCHMPSFSQSHAFPHACPSFQPSHCRSRATFSSFKSPAFKPPDADSCRMQSITHIAVNALYTRGWCQLSWWH